MRTESAEEFIARKENVFKKDLENKKIISMKDIRRKDKHQFIREAWVFHKQYNLPEKVFIFERLKCIKRAMQAHDGLKKGDIEYRVGYYIVGKIGRAKGRWIWGQFCPMIPQKDWGPLLKKAKKERVFLG